MNPDFERELLEKARRGDPSAAPFLVSCFGERLLGYARAHAPDLADADRERIVEMAIEAGVRAISSFDPKRGTLLAWFRTQVRYKTLASRRATPSTVPLDRDAVQPVADSSAKNERTDALKRAIARLSHEDQIILALRSSERLDYAEIAQRLDIAEDAARQRHSRALKRLRREANQESELKDLNDEVRA